MEQKIYKVERGDTLEKISEKTGFYMEEIRQWHNLRCENVKDLIEYGGRLPKEILLPMHAPKTFYKNIEPNPHEKLVMHTPEENERIFLKSLVFGEETKYRCEQIVITKINGIIQNHAETKREFSVKKQMTHHYGLLVKTELTDNIIKTYPENLFTALELLDGLDRLKCNAILQVNSETGKIHKILNHNEIIKKWKNHKIELQNKFSFIRGEQAKQEFEKFISLAENQILNEKNLIQDLNAKMFFDLFFDKYLITNENLFNPYTRTFHSQLFENILVDLNFKQDIVSENKSAVTIKKTGTIDKKRLDMKQLENLYDKKFKPLIQYKFSDFNFQYSENCTINTEKHLIENSEVTMVEEVKNNIQIFVNYSLKKIES